MAPLGGRRLFVRRRLELGQRPARRDVTPARGARDLDTAAGKGPMRRHVFRERPRGKGRRRRPMDGESGAEGTGRAEPGMLSLAEGRGGLSRVQFAQGERRLAARWRWEGDPRGCRGALISHG